MFFCVPELCQGVHVQRPEGTGRGQHPHRAEEGRRSQLRRPGRVEQCRGPLDGWGGGVGSGRGVPLRVEVGQRARAGWRLYEKGNARANKCELQQDQRKSNATQR